MRKKSRQIWCDVLLEKLKTLGEPVTFRELKNLVWDDPEARPSTATARHVRWKMTNMPVTVRIWGQFCLRHENITITRKISQYDKHLAQQLGLFGRTERVHHYKWCEHLDYTDTLDGAVCNDCQAEVKINP